MLWMAFRNHVKQRANQTLPLAKPVGTSSVKGGMHHVGLPPCPALTPTHGKGSRLSKVNTSLRQCSSELAEVATDATALLPAQNLVIKAYME